MKHFLFLSFALITAVLRADAQSVQTTAAYCIGLNVDGTPDEWDSCETPEITMTMTQSDIPGVAGSDMLSDALRVRFAHDGTNIYVLAKIRSAYYLNMTAEDANDLSHSVAVMWRVGEDATMFNMGGCSLDLPLGVDTYDCDAIKSYCADENNECNCDGRLVDVWHIESGEPGSIPGVQYPWRGPLVFNNGDSSSLQYDPTGMGRYQPSVERLYSGNDHTSNTDDEFSVYPCLRGDDGSSSGHLSDYRNDSIRYRNQLRYAWSHTAINSREYPFAEPGASGDYIYEFSRPLVTNENTDAQFEVGEEASFGFAFWTPTAVDQPWSNADHYVSPPDFTFGAVTLNPPPIPQVGDNSDDDSGTSSTFTKLNLSALLLIAVAVVVTAF